MPIWLKHESSWDNFYLQCSFRLTLTFYMVTFHRLEWDTSQTTTFQKIGVTFGLVPFRNHLISTNHLELLLKVKTKTLILQWSCGQLTVTPYLRAIPCRVSLSVTRCSMYFSPREAVTLAVLPYERILVRARLWDSSLSDSEPDLDRGKIGCTKRPPPSRIDRTGENSAIFPWLSKAPLGFSFNALADSLR